MNKINGYESMRNIKHLFVGLFICAVLVTICASCRTISEPRYRVSHGTIYNSSTQEIHDVRVVHEPTKTVVAINSILPDRSFDLGFEEQMLMADYAVFGWTDDAGKRHQQIVHLPRPLKESKEMHEVIYTIDQRGEILVRIKPVG